MNVSVRANPDAQKELLDKIMARANGIAEDMTTGPSSEDDGGVEIGEE